MWPLSKSREGCWLEDIGGGGDETLNHIYVLALVGHPISPISAKSCNKLPNIRVLIFLMNGSTEDSVCVHDPVSVQGSWPWPTKRSLREARHALLFPDWLQLVVMVSVKALTRVLCATDLAVYSASVCKRERKSGSYSSQSTFHSPSLMVVWISTRFHDKARSLDAAHLVF